MLLAAIAGACLLAGCGKGASQQAPDASATMRADAQIERVKSTAVARKPAAAVAHSVVARMDASSDRIIAEGKVHLAPGALSDAEVKRELRAERRAGAVIPSGESTESFLNAQSNSTGPGAEAQIPEVVWNPRSKPIADWIIPILQWAHDHGWTGTVTSGYRTYYEQAQLNAAGAFSAAAGLSNHETTRYPGGAVDVTDPGQLINVLSNYHGPLKLIGGVLGPVDPEHFSATGD